MARLTDRAVQSLKAVGVERWVIDPGAHGAGRLVLRIRAAAAGGSKSFYFRYNNSSGKREAIWIGPYDPSGDGKAGYTLAQARDRAREWSGAYRAGNKDLKAHFEHEQIARETQVRELEATCKQAEADAARGSFKALLEAYCNHLARRGAASARDVRWIVERNLFKACPELVERPAREITHRDLLPTLRQMVTEGKGRTAAKVRSFIHAAYQLALQAETNPAIPADLLGFGVDRNPAAALAAMTEFTRPGERELSNPELRAYLEELDKVGHVVVRSALILALYLGGQRPQQLVRVTASEVDLLSRTVTLRDPKGARKQPRAHVLPLTDLTAPLFEQLIAINGNARSLFASRRGNPMDITSLSGTVTRISRQLVASGRARSRFVMGDLRRTAETMLAGCGVSKDIRAQLLSHGISGIQARHYDRYSYMKEKLQALQIWERHLSLVRSGEAVEWNVVVGKFGRAA